MSATSLDTARVGKAVTNGAVTPFPARRRASSPPPPSGPSAARRAMLSLWREPLAHFTILGAALFVLYFVFDSGKQPIVVSAAVRQELSREYELLNAVPPNEQQMSRLVEQYVADEMLFREALEHGLHLNDPKIRQRMIGKMRFVMTDSVGEPSPEELVNFYSENVRLYYTERRMSFEHVFFESPPANVAEMLRRLRAGEPVSGERFWVGSYFDAYSESALRSMLGTGFTDALRVAPPNQWSGPVRSQRGVHFVRLQSIVEPEPLPFVEIRERVREDWFARRRTESVSRKLQTLEERYDIQVEN